jgi:hypothetical protein
MSDDIKHTLTEEEYQNWLQDRVSRHVLVRLGTYLSFLGLAGLFGLYQLISSGVEEGIRTRTSELKSGIVDELKDDATTRVKAEVAHTLLNLPEINELVNKEAEKTAKEAIKRLTDPEIVVPNLLRQIEQNQEMLNVIAKNITKSKTIISALLEPLRPIVVDPGKDIRERTAALQFLVIFEDPSNVKPIVTRIILDGSTKGTELRSIALNSYPFQQFSIESSVTMQVLADIENDFENERLVNSYRFFLSRVPTGQVGMLVEWLQSHPKHRATPILEQALAKMKDEDAIRDIDLLTADENFDVSLVGLRIFREIGINWQLSQEVRINTVKHLMEFLASPRSTDPFSIRGHLGHLHEAILAKDRSRILELKNQQAKWAKNALAEIYDEIEKEDIESIAEMVQSEWSDTESFVNDIEEEYDLDEEVAQYSSEQRRDVAREAISRLMRPQDWEPFVVVEFTRKKGHPEFQALAGAMFGAWLDSFERLKEENRGQAIGYAGELLRLSMREVPSGLNHPMIAQAMSRALKYATRGDVSEFLSAFYKHYLDISKNTDSDIDVVSPVLHAAFARNFSLDSAMQSSNRFLAEAHQYIGSHPDVAEAITASLVRFVAAPRAAKWQIQPDRKSMVSELIKSTLINIAADDYYKNIWGASVLEFTLRADQAIDIDITASLERHNAIYTLRNSSIRENTSEDLRQRVKALLKEVEVRLGWPANYIQVAKLVPVGTAPDPNWSTVDGDKPQWLRIDVRDNREYWVELRDGRAEYLLVDGKASVKARGRLGEEETLEIPVANNLADSDSALFIRLKTTREGGDARNTEVSIVEEDKRLRIVKAQTAEHAGQIEIGILYRGALSGNESTWVVFNAEQDRTYRIETSRMIGSIDTEMVLYGGPRRTRLNSDDDSGSEDLASMIELMSDTTSPYLVKISNLIEDGEGKFDLVITVLDEVSATPD